MITISSFARRTKLVICNIAKENLIILPGMLGATKPLQGMFVFADVDRRLFLVQLVWLQKQCTKKVVFNTPRG